MREGEREGEGAPVAVVTGICIVASWVASCRGSHRRVVANSSMVASTRVPLSSRVRKGGRGALIVASWIVSEGDARSVRGTTATGAMARCRCCVLSYLRVHGDKDEGRA